MPFQLVAQPLETHLANQATRNTFCLQREHGSRALDQKTAPRLAQHEHGDGGHHEKNRCQENADNGCDKALHRSGPKLM